MLRVFSFHALISWNFYFYHQLLLVQQIFACNENKSFGDFCPMHMTENTLGPWVFCVSSPLELSLRALKVVSWHLCLTFGFFSCLGCQLTSIWIFYYRDKMIFRWSFRSLRVWIFMSIFLGERGCHLPSIRNHCCREFLYKERSASRPP